MPIDGRRRPSFVCSCGHRAGVHFNTKERPNGPCGECKCQAFTPEAMCRCGHGKKAHAKGPCKQAYQCGCRGFTEAT